MAHDSELHPLVEFASGDPCAGVRKDFAQARSDPEPMVCPLTAH